ncbi:MAG TPA: AAA family ATPase, partial [Thermomicrobiales bacterium]
MPSLAFLGEAPPVTISFIPGTQPHLVGRDRELRMLRDHLAATCAGQGSLVLIGGEAGIGKTALAETLCREAAAQSAIILVGRCFDFSETPAYGPWLYLFERYHADAVLPALPAAFSQRGIIGDVTSQADLFRQVLDFFTLLSARYPLILLLDDLHWSDPASLDLLRFLAQSVAQLPLLILVTYRADELSRRHPLYTLLPLLVREAPTERINPHALDDAAVHTLIEERYRLPVSDSMRLMTYVQARAEGNAFYLGELLRSLEETGILSQKQAGWALKDLAHTRVPPLLRQVIDGRLGRLDEERQRLLSIAAVIGHEVPFDLWATIGAVDEAILLD